MFPSHSPPTGLIERFGLFIESLKRAVADGVRRDPKRLGPLSAVLWNYLGRTLRRLAALHARFEAGTLAPRPRPRPAAPRPAADPPAFDGLAAYDPPSDGLAPERQRRAPRLPPGAVLAEYWAGHFYAYLLPLLEDPEMRSLLAAAPQAGRLLRPLWRMMTDDPLPEPLRLPPRDPTPRPPPRPRPLWRFTPLQPGATPAAARGLRRSAPWRGNARE